jgi:hypothetical protein
MRHRPFELLGAWALAEGEAARRLEVVAAAILNGETGTLPCYKSSHM